MLEDLNKKCNSLLKRAKTSEDKKKYSLIQTILSNDKCFFEIPIETAYSILVDLGIKEDKISDVYMELISKKEYDDSY
jgi:hypothetical protein